MGDGSQLWTACWEGCSGKHYGHVVAKLGLA